MTFWGYALILIGFALIRTVRSHSGVFWTVVEVALTVGVFVGALMVRKVWKAKRDL